MHYKEVMVGNNFVGKQNRCIMEPIKKMEL